MKLLSKEEILSQSVDVDTCRICVIYFLIQDDKVVYVGQSTHGYARAVSHQRDKVFNKITFLPCAREKLDEVEAEYIFKFAPIYNKTIPHADGYIHIADLKTRSGMPKGRIKRIMTLYGVVLYHNFFYVEADAIQAIYLYQQQLEAEAENRAKIRQRKAYDKCIRKEQARLIREQELEQKRLQLVQRASGILDHYRTLNGESSHV